MSEPLVFEYSVTIGAPQQAVFDFAAEATNDPQWRAEVKRMECPKHLEIGDLAVEYAEFMGQELITRTALIEKNAPHSSTLETPSSEPAYLKSERTVTAIDDETSQLNYRLTFDREILRPVMPQLPPDEELKAWYGAAMQSYLQTLKEILELA